MPPYLFRVDQPELDSVGFVIDHFKKIAVKSPAHGEVRISEMQRRDKNESLWILNVNEKDEEIKPEVLQGSLRKTSCIITHHFIFIIFLQITDGSNLSAFYTCGLDM